MSGWLPLALGPPALYLGLLALPGRAGWAGVALLALALAAGWVWAAGLVAGPEPGAPALRLLGVWTVPVAAAALVRALRRWLPRDWTLALALAPFLWFLYIALALR